MAGSSIGPWRGGWRLAGRSRSRSAKRKCELDARGHRLVDGTVVPLVMVAVRGDVGMQPLQRADQVPLTQSFDGPKACLPLIGGLEAAIGGPPHAGGRRGGVLELSSRSAPLRATRDAGRWGVCCSLRRGKPPADSPARFRRSVQFSRAGGRCAQTEVVGFPRPNDRISSPELRPIRSPELPVLTIPRGRRAYPAGRSRSLARPVGPLGGDIRCLARGTSRPEM